LKTIAAGSADDSGKKRTFRRRKDEQEAHYVCSRQRDDFSPGLNVNCAVILDAVVADSSVSMSVLGLPGPHAVSGKTSGSQEARIPASLVSDPHLPADP
jgi:hypothetical protein